MGYSSGAEGVMPSERTPLRGRDASPQYVFMTSPNRIYRNKVRQFQCCICAGLLAIFVTAVVITVSYSVNHDIEDLDGNTTNMSDIQTLLTLSWPLADKKEPKWEVTDDSDLEVALEAGREALKMKDLFEAASPSLAIATPAYRHQKTVSTSPQARLLARSGYIMDLATKKLAILRGKNKTIGRGPTVSADWLPQDVCGNDPGLGFTCPATPFRTVDGSCNNLQHPVTWGVALRPFRRVIPADYGDGVSSPRRAFDGSELPTAREVSVTVHRPMYHDDPKFTVMLAVWGQFLDHDITATALSQGVNGSAISCCYAVNNPALKMNPECFPVRLAHGDPFYDMYNISCMEFVRSAPAPTCSFGPREQMNQASSYIDGSVVYGTTNTLMSILRSYSGGRLRMSLTPDGRELLPYSTDPNDGCNSEVERLKGRYCFMSGDARANENLHLTTMHLILARQHNKIADQLTVLNPLWSDERVFQETRRIISAQMQHISYNEFLTIILGPQLMDQLELSPKTEGYYDNYNASVDATIANNFATASFRFAHSLLPGLMKMLGNDTSSEEYVEMHKMLFNPYGLYQMGYMDKTVRGALETHVLKVDPYFSKEITQHLFEQSTPMGKGPCGLDLVSLNIQRGRDHGLRSYPYWREYCGFPRPKLFSDLNGIMDPEVIERISSIYKTVDDIDMYTGVLSEIPLDDGILGPTVTCLLTDQFIRLKQGDRFWYETSQQPQAFTPEQLTELRKTTLAQMICDNSDEVMAVQPMVMRSIGPGNERVNCSDLRRPDWGAWKELPGGSFQRAGITRVQLFEGATVVTVKAAGKSKKLALGATVTGGSITGPSGTIWSGDLPVNIHLPLFDTVAGPEETTSPDDPPPVYGHGIMWDGDLTADETGIATFSGTYSKPTYVHGTALANFSIKWSSGNFNIKMKLLWNNTKNGTIDISGSYSSPLFLKAVKPKVMMTDTDLAKYTVNSAAASTSGVLRAPLILHGTFSPDRTSFIWSGNATLIIPSPPPPPPPTSALWSDGTTPVETQFLLKESAAAAGVVAAFPKKNAFGATVTGGSVQTASGSLWSGTIPVDIPLPLFDSVAGPGVASAAMDPPPVYGHGIIWDGTLSADASGLAHFRGTFSMPKFIHGTALTNFSIKWTSGNFDLTMQLLWNSTKNATVDLSGSFTSPLLLRQRKPVLMSSGKASYMVEDAISAEASAMSMSAPLILYGDFSPDRTSFKWYGNVTLLIPTLVPTPLVSAMAYNTDPGMTLLAAKPKSRLAVGVSVLSGSVTAGSDSSSPVTWWSGDLPAAVPAHPFDKPSAAGTTSKKAMALPTFGGGITWNGKLSSDGAGGASLTGTFSMPFFTHGSPLNFSIQWWTGEFALQLRYLWNTTLDGVIETGKEYSSPVFFRAMKTPLLTKSMVEKYESDGLKVGPIDNNMQFIMAAEEALSAAPKVPIVLLGSYSPDKSVFWWSGAAVVSAPLPPSPMVPMQLSSKASKPSSRTKPISPTIYQTSAMLTPAPVRSLKATNGKVGFTVVSGWLATGAGTLWDGTIPITIPLPAFDSVATLGDSGLLAAPPVYGHGVVWKGKLSPTSPLEADVQGTFSLPSFVHGGTPNFSVSWTDGEFSLHAKLMWNASLAGLIDPDTTYTSPIFFQGIKPMTEKSSIDTTPVEHVMEQLAANIDGIANPAVRVPMILQGTFAPDKTAFYWGGNMIASFSKSRSLPYLQKKDAKMQQSAFSAKKDLALINGPMSPIIRLGATVLSGSVTSGWSTWWDGSLPVTIPIPAFDSFSLKQAGTVGAAPMVYGHGVTWQGSITSSAPDEVSLEGSFSLPKYIHAPWPTNFSIEWIEGQFSLRMKLLWNASLDGEVVPDRIFSSPVYFSGGSPADNARVLLAGVELSDEASALQMAAESLEVTGTAARAPIILQGTYTPDRTSFLWSGNVFVSIPRMTAGPLLVQAAVKPGKGGKKTDAKDAKGGGKDAKGGKFGGKGKKPAAATKPTGGAIGFTAITGTINANFTPPPTPPPPIDDSNSTENVTLPPPLTYFSVWTGVTPMNLPVPFFNVSGTDPTADPVAVAALTISWNGTLTLTAAGAVNLEGEYSLPLEMHQVLGNMTVAWSGGTFSLEAQQLWKAAVAGMVQPGVTYTSPVFYRSTTPSTTDDPVLNAATGKAAAKATGPAAPGAPTKVPIILQGTFSPDNSQFIWAGNALLIFPWPA